MVSEHHLGPVCRISTFPLSHIKVHLQMASESLILCNYKQKKRKNQLITVSSSQSPKSLCTPHYLHPLLKLSPPLLPVQFTQSSIQTATTPIVYSIYTVRSAVFFLHSFLILPYSESQSILPELPHESPNDTRQSFHHPL
jgi:hypothetical protein